VTEHEQREETGNETDADQREHDHPSGTLFYRSSAEPYCSSTAPT
jgi:hypothetical protein